MTTPEDHEAVVVGRYVLHREIARGGMAAIHLAHLIGDVGFSRIVAAKRLHPELAENGEFVAMFLDEARVASKVHHRNIVPVLDVVTAEGEVVLVQELVRGAPLAKLLQTAAEAKSHVPLPIAASIACQVLAGLQAAHDTTDEVGTPLHVVHRDVSPQNIMIATDGTARLLDFGVAKAAMAAHVTRKGTFKGKLTYSAPEHIRGSATHQSDIYSLSVVLWELATGRRMHRSSMGVTRVIERVLSMTPPSVIDVLEDERAFISGYRWQQLAALAPIVKKGLAADPKKRWQSATDMEEAIVEVVPIASGSEVSEWVTVVAQQFLEERERMIAEVEGRWRNRSRLGSPAPDDLAIPVRPHATTPAHAIELRPSWRLALWVKRNTTRSAMILGGVLAALAIAIVLAWPRAHATPPAALYEPPVTIEHAAPPAPPPPAPAPKPAVAPLAGSGEQCAVPAAAPPPPPPRPAPVMHTVAHPPPAPKRVAPPPPPPPVKRVAPAAPPPPAPAPAPAVHAPSKPPIDCNPPYYFDGTKKVFKPACV